MLKGRRHTVRNDVEDLKDSWGPVLVLGPEGESSVSSEAGYTSLVKGFLSTFAIVLPPFG